MFVISRVLIEAISGPQDVDEIKTGADWQDALNYAVSNCEVLVPLVTPHYGETQWTNREVNISEMYQFITGNVKIA